MTTLPCVSTPNQATPTGRPLVLRLWQTVLRFGVWPHYPDECLLALYHGLLTDSPFLVQRKTVLRKEGFCVGACALAYGLWKGLGLKEACEVESRTVELWAKAEATLGESGAIRKVLEEWDAGEREDAIAGFLKEVEREIRKRELDRRGA